MASAQTTLSTAGPAVIMPNTYAITGASVFERDLFWMLDAAEWRTGAIVKFGEYARFEALELSRFLGYTTEDTDQAIAYLNQILRQSDRRFPGWRFALKPSALIMEFDQARAEKDLEDDLEMEA